MRPAREIHIARWAGVRRIAVVASAVTLLVWPARRSSRPMVLAALLVLALLDPPPRLYAYRY